METIEFVEAVILGIWLLGIVASLFAATLTTTKTHASVLVLVAVALPIIGSVVAITSAAELRWELHQDRREARHHV